MSTNRNTHLLLSLLLVFLGRTWCQKPADFFFYGTLIDDFGVPIEGAQIQLWQTDPNGNYAHPGNPWNGFEILASFGYYGTATTDTEGKFEFKTHRPGIYSSRPITHFHYKVFVEGIEVLTSQFYFRDENIGSPDILTLDLSYLSDGTTITNKTVVVGNSGPNMVRLFDFVGALFGNSKV
jgi:protocatechuate 3,4-dioxygenase beta subunit